jgi:GxxExxY protein
VSVVILPNSKILEGVPFMTLNSSQILHGDITEQIIKSYYHVYNTLGYGFLEKVYENALAASLRKCGFEVIQQMPVKVFFEGVLVGDYFADLVVNGCIIVEIKAAEAVCSAHEAQLVNYLKATPMEVGLLVNFGQEPEFKRKLFTNDRKPGLPISYPNLTQNPF